MDQEVLKPQASYILRGQRVRVVLTRGGRVRIGRHASNDLVIDHHTVSRFHARITWPEELSRPLVEDLGSQNGTYLGGVEVRRGELAEERETIGIGAVVVQAELEHPALLPSEGPLACRLFNQFAESDLEGTLGRARTLQDVLLDLERARRTGTLQVRRAGLEARLTLAAGRILDARAGELSGMEAVHATLEVLDEGRFTLQADIEPRECGLCLSPRELFARGVTARVDRAPILRDASRTA